MKIKDSFFTMAGLLFGRGSLINPGHNFIVLYFFNDEDDFVKEVKQIFNEYEPMIKKIPLDHIGVGGSINGMYIAGKYGREIKRSFNLEKFHITDRKIPKKIIESDQDEISKFVGGIFSMNCDINKRGFIFFRYPVITLKEIGIEAITAIQKMLKDMGIESKLENNSEKRYMVRGEEKIVPSILTIEKDQAKIFAQKISIINPKKRIKLEKITFSF